MKFRFRLFLQLIALTVITMLLAACRLVVDTQVNPDGSGVLRRVVIYTAKETENFAQKPENAGKGICDNAASNLPPGSTFTEEKHAGETHCVTERPFANVGELRQFYAGMKEVTVHKMDWEWGRLTYDVEVDLAEDKNATSREWRLTLPGTLGKHNADKVEGQTLIWQVDKGEQLRLQAQSTVGLSVQSLGPAGLVGVSLILVGGLMVIVAAGMAFQMLARQPAPQRKAL